MDVLGFEKVVFHPEIIERIRRGEATFPLHATIDLGNYCNHRCLWCAANEYQEGRAHKADIERLLGFLERARARGLRAVGYVGHGEPTAHPRFAELTRRVNELGLEQGLFTNGFLLDRVMDELAHFFTYVRISLDAGTAETHAVVHDVPGHFDAILRNIATLVGRRGELPTVGIQFAVHDRNFADLAAAARLARTLGADYFSVKPVFKAGAVGARIDKNRLTHADVAPVVRELQSELEDERFSIFFRPFQIRSETADRNVLKYDRCLAGFFNLWIGDRGELVTCAPHQIPVGNIDDDLAAVEQKVLEISKRLDVSRCPGGCRYHALNHLVDTVLKPERARRFHPNFF